MMRLDINSRRLRYFTSLIEHGSFAQAASALHISQPALSIAIKTLEKELNTELIDRSIKPICPTVYGEIVYRSAKTLNDEGERLHRELRDMANLNNGSISIVYGNTFPQQCILETHSEIRRTYPGFSLNIEMGSYTANVDELINGGIDLIFSQLPAKQSDTRVSHRPILTDRFEAVSAPNHPLVSIDKLSLADLTHYPWVSGGPLDSFLPGWSSIFKESRLSPPQAIVHTMTPSVTHALLNNRQYLAMLPVKSIESEIASGQLTVLKMPKLIWNQTQGVSTAQNRSKQPSVQYFLDRFFDLFDFM
ncbi:MAG: LysR family transcriptional regulator [Alphaproteobacteria bacterium]